MKNDVRAGRGANWFAALTGNAPVESGYSNAVLVADARLAGKPARFIAVVPDEENRFPRVRSGEVGLVEGWEIARAVRELAMEERRRATKTPIVAVIDVASQAYGRLEEGFGIHQALAGAAGAYADARLAGHPVIGLIVGKAISGAFLAHGYQANRLIAIDDPEVVVHAMGKESAARITHRAVHDLETLASKIPPMAYDIGSYASLGLLWRSLRLQNPDQPDAADFGIVRVALEEALADILDDPSRGLASSAEAKHRQATARVRELMRQQWSAIAS